MMILRVGQNGKLLILHDDTVKLQYCDNKIETFEAETCSCCLCQDDMVHLITSCFSLGIDIAKAKHFSYRPIEQTFCSPAW